MVWLKRSEALSEEEDNNVGGTTDTTRRVDDGT